MEQNNELKPLDEEALACFLAEWRKRFRGWKPAKGIDRLANLPASTLAKAICQQFGRPAANPEAEQMVEALEFAKAAIRDAIYPHVKFEPDTGEAVIDMIDDALSQYRKAATDVDSS